MQDDLLVQQQLLRQLLVLGQRLYQQVRQWCGLYLEQSVPVRILRLRGYGMRVEEVLSIGGSLLITYRRIPSSAD
jgi:hypothetical protein